jgi:hypothetical protein
MAEQEQKQKQKLKINKFILLGCVILALIGIILIAFVTVSYPTANTPSVPKISVPTKTSVQYTVEGWYTGIAVTLNNDTGGTEQYDVGAVSFSKYYPDFQNNFLYISAQNQGNYGSVTVSIYVDGRLYKSASSSGGYVIATASGTK